jgi:carbamate kinase
MDTNLTVVVALGGNALLERGEPPTTENQRAAARRAAVLLGQVSLRSRLLVTHGNGPQVGQLALLGECAPSGSEPLDVLGAETVGQIGYIIETELDNQIDHQDVVTVVTRTLVDAEDPGFKDPSKFVGPVYSEAEARTIAAQRGWTVKRDGDKWRRVVPSPEPLAIVQIDAIRRLADEGFLVVCAGGGGIPVILRDGHYEGVEAVVDKDLASALLAEGIGADLLVLATDVTGVYAEFGTPGQRLLGRVTPRQLRSYPFPAGSMGPKVQAVSRFVERTGKRAVIGALGDITALVDGTVGTQVVDGSLEEAT